MFPTNGTSHLTSGMACPRGEAHVIIVATNAMLQIYRILVTRPRPRRPGRSAQLVGAVVDAAVEAVDAVFDAKSTAIIGARAMKIGMGIEMIMEMLFERG